MNDIILGQEFQSPSDVEYDLPELILVVLDACVELLVVNAVHLLVVVLLALEFIQRVAEGIPALLVEYPSIFLVDEVIVEFDQVFDALAAGELLLGGAAELEEVRAEPDLLDVRLVAALRDDLLHRVLLLALLVLAQPHEGEASPSEQFDLVEAVGEAVAEGLEFLLAHVVGVLPLFLPLEFDLVQGLLPLGVDLLGALLGGHGVLGGAFLGRELVLLAGEDLRLLDASLLDLLFFEGALEFVLLAARVELLLVAELQVLETFGDVLLEGGLLDAGAVGLVGLAEAVVLAAVGGFGLLEGGVLDFV